MVQIPLIAPESLAAEDFNVMFIYCTSWARKINYQLPKSKIFTSTTIRMFSICKITAIALSGGENNDMFTVNGIVKVMDRFRRYFLHQRHMEQGRIA